MFTMTSELLKLHLAFRGLSDEPEEEASVDEPDVLDDSDDDDLDGAAAPTDDDDDDDSASAE